MTDTTPASDADAECSMCFDLPPYKTCGAKLDCKTMRELQADNERLRMHVDDMEAAYAATSDERDKYKAEAEQWQKAASEQVARAEGLEDENDRQARHITALEIAEGDLRAKLDAAENAMREALDIAEGFESPRAGMLREALREALEHFTDE